MTVDHIVVGSGPTGAMAARTLVDLGQSVLMLDVGHRDPHAYASLIPDRPFLEIRRSDHGQHRYFLGAEFEGVPLGQLRAGSTITTPRRYLTDLIDELTPAVGEGFQPVESLAYGGLGNTWGLVCFAFSHAELTAMGLDPTAMDDAYRRVAARIGLSGERDDCAPYTCGPIHELQPALDLDDAANATLAAYRARRAELNRRRVYAGKPLLALLSRDFDGRRACRYDDMDFWADHGGSAYRPAITLDRLRSSSAFTYRDAALVTRFARSSGSAVVVEYVDLATGERSTIEAGSLILSAGALGTARIVLRSVYPDPAARPEVPILSDPYYYVLCARPGLFGSVTNERRHSVTQLVVAYDPSGDGSHVPVAAFTSYRSMLLYRLIKEAPIGRADARALLQFLQSGLMVAGIHHPDFPGPGKSLALVRDDATITGDAMRIRFSLDAAERQRIARDQRVFKWAFRQLGALPLRTLDLGFGSSAHYAGALPFDEPAPHGTDRKTGRLNGWDNVYVADGSPFRSLPAKGITLTLMAYADLVARRAALAASG